MRSDMASTAPNAQHEPNTYVRFGHWFRNKRLTARALISDLSDGRALRPLRSGVERVGDDYVLDVVVDDGQPILVVVFMDTHQSLHELQVVSVEVFARLSTDSDQ